MTELPSTCITTGLLLLLLWSRVAAAAVVSPRFVQVSSPTSAAGLSAAGVLEADALLLAPEEGVRDSSAQADAQVKRGRGREGKRGEGRGEGGRRQGQQRRGSSTGEGEEGRTRLGAGG